MFMAALLLSQVTHCCVPDNQILVAFQSPTPAVSEEN